MAVKVDRTVIAKCRYVAELRGVTLAEYLTDLIRPIADKDFAKASKGGES